MQQDIFHELHIKPQYCRLLTFCSLVFILQLVGCKKLIEVEAPNTNLNAGNVYTNDGTAASVLTDLYAEMSAQNNSLTGEAITSIPFYAGLSADELKLFATNNASFFSYYSNDLTSESFPNLWKSIYPIIFVANSALEGLSSSEKLTPAVKQQLLGEAYFIRAFAYFYLVNLYGDIPLILTTDWKTNALFARISKIKIYEQIVSDLKAAQNLLSENYLKADAITSYAFGSEERVRPSKWAATALLARTYLYKGEWSNAEVQATNVIDKISMFDILPDLNNVFNKNNKEAIWQLQPVGIGSNANAGEGKLFVLPSSGPSASSTNPVFISDNLLNTFEVDDLRKTKWVSSVTLPSSTITYYYPFKYKIGNVSSATLEYPTILRLAEQYLIRAEARAQQNKIAASQADLNIIRNRAGLGNTTASDQSSLLSAILHERQVELFTEWGHRWLDLKRTGLVSSKMSSIAIQKGGTWQNHDEWYPIPASEIDVNPNLIQTPGY